MVVTKNFEPWENESLVCQEGFLDGSGSSSSSVTRSPGDLCSGSGCQDHLTSGVRSRDYWSDSNDVRYAECSEDSPICNRLSQSQSSGIRLKKQLGLVDCVGIIVGVMIGSGIFISPTGVIKYSGSVGASLVIWAITGAMSTIGALCYAELGTMIPKSGGDYAYISEAFGPLPAFLYLWVALLIIMPTGNTVIGLTFANYILQPFFPDCDRPPDTAVRLLAALVISFLTYINCTSVKAATKIQDIFTATKIFALGVIIGTGAYHLGTGHLENYEKPFENTDIRPSGIATAFYQGIFSFAGWNCLNFVVEELHDPYRNLPRAILISLPLVTVVYFLTNVAYFSVLTPMEVLSSSAVAVTFGNRMLGVMAWIIPFFVACSTFGGINGGIFASARLFFVGAREGHLPETLALINIKALTPMPSLMFLGGVSILMLVSSDTQALINYVSFSENIFIIMSITALLKERYLHPNRPRPIKIWIGFPILFFSICLFLFILPLLQRPSELLIASVVIATGIPVYYVFVAKEIKSQIFKKFKASITTTMQLLTFGVPQSREE